MNWFEESSLTEILLLVESSDTLPLDIIAPKLSALYRLELLRMQEASVPRDPDSDRFWERSKSIPNDSFITLMSVSWMREKSPSTPESDRKAKEMMILKIAIIEMQWEECLRCGNNKMMG